MEQFDVPGAYEALARAHALAGNGAEAQHWLEQGRVEAAKIEDEDDRTIIETDLASIRV